MASPDPTQAIAGAIALAAIAAAFIVQVRAAMRVAVDGGKVRTDELRMPDALVAVVLAGFFLALLGKSVAHGGINDDLLNADLAFQSAALFALFAAGVSGFLKFRGVRMLEFLGLRALPPLRAAAWALGLVLAAVPLTGVANAITLLVTHGTAEQQPLVKLFRDVAQSADQTAMLKIFVAGVLIAPASEEFLFRGFFYPLGKRYFGALGSALVCSMLFAAIHANLAAFAGLTVLALCLTLAYERTGSLLVPIGMHAIYNSASLAFIYLQARGVIRLQ